MTRDQLLAARAESARLRGEVLREDRERAERAARTDARLSRAYRSNRDPAAEFRASSDEQRRTRRSRERYRYHHAWEWTGRVASCRHCGIRRRVIKSNLCEFWGAQVVKFTALKVPPCLVGQ